MLLRVALGGYCLLWVALGGSGWDRLVLNDSECFSVAPILCELLLMVLSGSEWL